MFKDPGGGRRRASEGKLTEEYEPSAPKISRMVPALRSPRNSWWNALRFRHFCIVIFLSSEASPFGCSESVRHFDLGVVIITTKGSYTRASPATIKESDEGEECNSLQRKLEG